MTVYLIHLDQPLARGTSPSGQALKAGHYIGYADDLVERILAHKESTWEPLPEPIIGEHGEITAGTKHGEGSTFLAFANYRGVSWQLARTWPEADRSFERHIKNLKAAPRLCPICNPGAETRAGLQEKKE